MQFMRASRPRSGCGYVLFLSNVNTKHALSQTKLLAKENRGLLLDIVVFVLNLFLMQRLTGYVFEVFHFANEGDQAAQFVLVMACVAMYVLPAAGAVLKRWHFHQ